MNQLDLKLANTIEALYEPPGSRRKYSRAIVFLVLSGLAWSAVWLVGWAISTLLRP